MSRKARRPIAGLVALALVFVLSTSALAQGTGGYEILWFTVGGGGGESSGGSYVLAATIGGTGPSAAGGGLYDLEGGLQDAQAPEPTEAPEVPPTPDVPPAPEAPPAPRLVYLPMLSFDFCSAPTVESEPNDSFGQANPVCRNHTLSGRHDQYDVFRVFLRPGNTTYFTLTNGDDTGVQMQLYYRSADTLLKYRTSPPYVLNYGPVHAGTYYIYIYTAPGNTSNYTLQLASP